MKIIKIREIKDFGLFDDFQWDDSCPEFKKYNFFYGWNYSGKTTLSRVFRCLELRAMHSDFTDAKFSLKSGDGNITQRDISNDYPIRVFNEDFIQDNFQWNNEKAKIEPVLILGKEAKDLENKAKDLSERKEIKNNKLKELEKESLRKKRDLETSLTDRASEIRNILGISNPREFDKNKLEEQIENIKNSYKNYILSVDDKEAKLNIYNSKKMEKVEFKVPFLKLSVLIKDVENILNRTVTAQEVIDKLKENPRLSHWVREGISLHHNEKDCQFCGGPLPPDLLERLNRHFSHEFDNLMKEISEKEMEIVGHIEKIKNLALPDKARLYEDLHLEFEKKLEILKIVQNDYIGTLELLIEELKKKRERPFNSVTMEISSEEEKKLTGVFNEIKLVIDRHNIKVDSFETEKVKAKEVLINHFTADFIEKKDYFETKKEIKDIKRKIDILREEIVSLDKEVEHIHRQIKAEAIGADRINKYLAQFFNDDKLKVEMTNDGKYRLYRDDQIAKNLSTGEKNIISLIYFFARLEETHFDFSNAVIFIDDPVSSLDSNHIFKVYGFINEKLRNCGQLFITTHNFDFFNLLKDLNKDFFLKEERNFYLIKKVQNKTKKFSYIEKLPIVLFKYRSEYNYLFSILRSVNTSNDKFELLYILPNILRRFFEGYLYMKYPNQKSFKHKAEDFLKDMDLDSKQRVLKLIDEYSHETNPTHAQKFPDVEEVEYAVKFILEAIEKKDKEHYEALESSCSVS